MTKRRKHALSLITFIGLCLAISFPVFGAEPSQPASQNRNPNLSGVEIGTNELKQILLDAKTPVIDVRPEKEYAASHIPGSINIFETKIDRMMELCAASGGVALYCNGPFCHKTNRVAENLAKKGCTTIRKYQDGLPVWRAFGNTAETDVAGLAVILPLDKTAVLVDARTKEEFKAGSMPNTVNLQAGEIETANQDGRLPYTNHGTRVIVFGSTVAQARQLAEAIAHRAYWNSSYLTTTFDDLKKEKSRLW
jgi:rhodanese-related sulfurtransferase